MTGNTPRSERGRMRDLLAEYVAEGDSVKQAAEKLGKSHQWGYVAFREIKAGLGWQAS